VLGLTETTTAPARVARVLEVAVAFIKAQVTGGESTVGYGTNGELGWASNLCIPNAGRRVCY
jgi:hypothetical protein